MSSNKSAKNKLIKLYGAECFIEKLKLRQDDGKRYYSSKKEYQRMKQLTYHHILERSKGGKATVENGALLSAENHAWFHRQPEEARRAMNEIFQQYKKCQVVFVDELNLPFQVRATVITPRELMGQKRNKQHSRAKEKRQTQRLIQEYEEEERE